MKLFVSSIILAFIALSLGLVSSNITCANTNAKTLNVVAISVVTQKQNNDVIQHNKYNKNIMSKHLIKLPKNKINNAQPIKHYSFFEQITFMTDNLQSWLTSNNNNYPENNLDNLITNQAMCS